MTMQIVYLIQHSETKEIYVGTTTNLNTRLKEHNNNGRKSTTRKNGSWQLIYAEAYRAKDDALRRERRLKDHGKALQELKKRINESLIS